MFNTQAVLCQTEISEFTGEICTIVMSMAGPEARGHRITEMRPYFD